MKVQLFALMVLLTGCAPFSEGDPISETFDWQGHRGARGLLPENSIPGFLKAMEYPIATLELDVVISRDSQVVVSHEPWMSSSICSMPDGQPVQKSQEEELTLFQMDYVDIAAFDCGRRGHEDFPNQVPTPTVKPKLSVVVEAVSDFCQTAGRPLPYFNIEIKSRPDWDGNKTPAPGLFASLVVEEIKKLGIADRTCIQSFDPRSLQAVHQIDAGITTAYLIANMKSLEKNLEELGYQPEIYSPNFRLVVPKMLEKAHERGMKVIPWTVNETKDMNRLKLMGVDGIITDYPNLIEQLAD